MKGLASELRYLQRQELEKPVLEAFLVLVGKLQLREPDLGKTGTYALNQNPYMKNYLMDERLSISNNAAL